MGPPRRYELTDFEWSIIEHLLPNKPRGMPRADDRAVLNGIYRRLRTGSPWADIADRYGPSTTCYNRFVRWRKIGAWDRIFEAVSKAYDGDIQIVDSTTIRVHQHGANGKRGLFPSLAAAGNNPDPRCLGRSRGGLTTKIHAVVDADGLPIALQLTPGQVYDVASARNFLGTISAGQMLLADAGYDSDALCEMLTARRAWACVKPMPNRKRRPAFSVFLFRQRNLVERFFNKLKHFRAVAPRFEKDPVNCLALVKLAAARIRMRFMSR